MAHVSFNEVENTLNQPTTQNVGTQVNFFQLANDGDEALVRILHDTVDTFDLLTFHANQEVNGKLRKINCVRESHDPTEKCPLCKRGMNTETKIFIHILEYKKDEAGNVVCEPKIWERSLVWARRLRDLINEYGPLSDSLFKIKRHGVKGDPGTTFDVLYAAPAVYKPELYPKRTELFDNYSVLGTIVMDKTSEELEQFITTGAFPQKDGAKQNVPTGQTFTPAAEQTPIQAAPVQPAPQRQAAWGNQGTTAPARYY